MSREIIIKILEDQETYYLNGLASEYRQDIIKGINEDLKLTQSALKWMRDDGNFNLNVNKSRSYSEGK